MTSVSWTTEATRESAARRLACFSPAFTEYPFRAVLYVWRIFAPYFVATSFPAFDGAFVPVLRVTM